MKKSNLLCLFLFSLFFISCAVRDRGWAVQEFRDNGLYMYKITAAPEQHKDQLGKLICYRSTQRNSTWGWPVSHKEEIEEFISKKDLEPAYSKWGDKVMTLPRGFFVTKISQEELSYIWDVLSANYAGFTEMQEKGFSRKKLMAVKDSRDFDKLFNEYIDDCHFALRIRDYGFDKPTARDEGTVASRDPEGFYFEKETSNAYYIRFTDCSSQDYKLNFQTAAAEASKKDFIILDARSNSGGDNNPLFTFKNYLNMIDYKGTVICLQDNWSFSSGELWHTFGTPDIKFKTMLIGTHSGGMQRFDTYQYYNEKLDVFIYAGRFPNDGLISENWLGEGKGYEPQIWATTENMKSTLEKLGVELDDIQFK
ncbi:MAG: hypothetical protein MJ185_00205 [Treponema sp.]|nr:hypothetical protein [Treponema sp.]